MTAVLETRTNVLPAVKRAALLSWGPGEGPNPEPTHPGPHEPGPVGFNANIQKQRVVNDSNHPIPWLPHSVGQRVRASTLYLENLAYIPQEPDADPQPTRPDGQSWPQLGLGRRSFGMRAEEHESKPYDTEGDAGNWATEDALRDWLESHGK